MERMRMGPIKRRSGGPKEWDESGNNVIALINVSYDESGLRSIQFGYVKNGALVMSETYGCKTPCICSRRILRLNHESEFVTGISGEVHSDNITSLTFHTNQRKHEALHLTFDSRKAVPYKSEFYSGILERSEFLGFFGSSDRYKLSSIGFYVRFALPDATAIKQEHVSTSRR